MTKLEAIKARCEKTTKGPWLNDSYGNDVVTAEYRSVAKTLSQYFTTQERDENRDFIAHSRTDIPLLLAVVEAVKKREAAAKVVARVANNQVEHAANVHNFDVACDRLDAALAELEKEEL